MKDEDVNGPTELRSIDDSDDDEDDEFEKSDSLAQTEDQVISNIYYLNLGED